MRVVGVGRTDVGKKRDHNEDYALLAPELGLYVVCDGMGGHAAGEVAAEIAATTVRRHIEAHRDVIDDYDDSAEARERVVRLVEDAVQRASSEVFRLATSEAGRAGMGTTLTMMLALKTVGVMGHVGDTRLYMCRDGRLHQLSEDHTYVHELMRRGTPNASELAKGPYANIITRAVGIQASVHVDTLLFDMLSSDTFLLCSDGLSKHIETDAELATYLNEDDVDGIPQRLLDVANDRGGSDNITAIVLRSTGGGADAADKSRTTEVNLKLGTLKEISLFRDLDMGELCKVLNIVRAQQVERGEVVVREGDAGESLYAILDGKFAVTREGRAVTWLSSGTHFGEMALFNNRPRSATVQATKRSRVLVIERARFKELVHKEPQLGVKLLWAFSQGLATRLDESTLQVVAGPSDGDTQLSLPPLRPLLS